MMNDTAGQQRNDQRTMSEFDFGDYITSAANDDGQHQSQLEIFGEFHDQPRNHQTMNLESNMNTQSMLESRMNHLHQNQPQSLAEMLNLKGRLEQQIKLRTLSQDSQAGGLLQRQIELQNQILLQQIELQTQILQQQIELINGQHDQQKEAIFHGLLTPGPSTELPAVVPKDLVPPMMLQSDIYMNSSSATALLNQLSPHPSAINPSFSAPAALAFPTSPPFPLPSPAQPGYDLSPLTSPWILPGPTAQQPQQTSQHISASQGQQRPRLKRTVSSSGDDQDRVRKRVSPNVGSSLSNSRGSGPSTSTTSSATSTPAMRGIGTGTGPMQFVAPSSDTPSPVDLSMPPPAPPLTNSDANAQTSSASSSSTISGSTSTSVSPDLAPMTPASILNLRKIPVGLIPSALSLTNTEKKDGSGSAVTTKTNKGKSVAKSGATSVTAATTRRRGSATKPGPSPSLKPLLPGAIPPTPSSPLAQASNSTQQPSNHSLAVSSAGGPPRKTSHKAAEQKRRDSLKTSFDELRLLLPPVPLLPEDGTDEPPLPGSMPPRGPPKGDADGPNRGVSKLALLRCGNGYIRELKGKVGRRDREIDVLRDEVRRLRGVVGEEAAMDDLDLERDVDEGIVPCTRANSCGVEEGDAGGDGEGE